MRPPPHLAIYFLLVFTTCSYTASTWLNKVYVIVIVNVVETGTVLFFWYLANSKLVDVNLRDVIGVPQKINEKST